VDNIEKPKCAVVAQQIQASGGDLQINQTNAVVSNVFIESIDFQDCF